MRRHKFFDTIDPMILVEKLEEQDFGRRKSCHTLITHLAPRVFKVKGHLGEFTQLCGRSILAGCIRSLSLARAYTNSEVDDIRNIKLEMPDATGEFEYLRGKPQGHWVKQHVDDLTIIIWSTSQEN